MNSAATELEFRYHLYARGVNESSSEIRRTLPARAWKISLL